MYGGRYGPFEESYDPSLEFPGIEEEGEIPDLPPTEAVPSVTSTCFLRLVVLKSAALPSKYRLAILSGYPEIQFGRDKPVADTVVPRIRLREMEVSKFHATAYWDGDKQEWGLVDMGSMHGTFWGSGSESLSSKVRLSAPRTASLPQPLHHLDRLSVGKTTFEVHIHQDDLPCEVCASSGHEIPLFHDSGKEKSVEKVGKREVLEPRADPKKSLSMLKSSLLQQHHQPYPTSSSLVKYTDRADRRRRMYGSLPPGPGPHLLMQVVQRHHSTYEPPPPPPQRVVSDPPQAVSSSNVGHGLLTKMGWQPGTTLGLPASGTDGNHLLEPIQVKHTTHRAGLGVASTSRRGGGMG
jgi:hypothetical protein